ncbi:hypothetical protein [Macrococcoides caseolyticum]|uniref:hypothetical protein n=1 Tax=Macrococcoides caseolyticum TaxID=69966 RepID=UPI000C31BF4F|nr:hypothetical protein [Macrococcus caseolyticus]PKE18487.1 hypothetical protein CW679_10710 [Macrococcus caseolyticus]PKF39888.1 hypothetical protein CW661_11035 [Macrococcus caseolyticus]QYA34871.1 hypothetical protein KYI08_09265 [Macrococcus caseolyticus]
MDWIMLIAFVLLMLWIYITFVYLIKKYIKNLPSKNMILQQNIKIKELEERIAYLEAKQNPPQ